MLLLVLLLLSWRQHVCATEGAHTLLQLQSRQVWTALQHSCHACRPKSRQTGALMLVRFSHPQTTGKANMQCIPDNPARNAVHGCSAAKAGDH